MSACLINYLQSDTHVKSDLISDQSELTPQPQYTNWTSQKYFMNLCFEARSVQRFTITDMSFDPLTFFEPGSNDPQPILNRTEQQLDQSLKCISFENIEVQTDDLTHLQILDLPQPNQLLPFSILRTILKLFKADTIKNFDSNVANLPAQGSTAELNTFLNQRSLTLKEVESLAAFLHQSLDAVVTISLLPKSSSSLTTGYLTKVVSFPFENYTEEEREEIYDLASHVMTASSAPAMKGNTTRLVQIDGLDREIYLFEPAFTEDKVGNITWGASLELVNQIVKGNTSYWLDDSRIPLLEMGAGTGLVTIVLRALGHRVISTDLPEIMDNLKKNIELNKLSYTELFDDNSLNAYSLHLASLDWRSPNEFLSKTKSRDGYKCVILSDPVYSPQHPIWIKDTLNAVLSRNSGSKVVFMVGRRDRFQDVRDNLWNLMESIGLKELFYEIIEGYDDYGVLEYDYKVFGR